MTRPRPDHPPVPEPELTYLRDVRQGKYTKDEALTRSFELDREIQSLKVSSRLPARADQAAINSWVIDVHRHHRRWTA